MSRNKRIAQLIIQIIFTQLHRLFDINRPIPNLGDESCLPIHLRDKKHNDWPWPINLIPRSWTVICEGPEFDIPPRLLAGNSGWTLEDKHRFGHFTEEFLDLNGAILPIPKPRHWVITAVMYDWIPLPYFAITFPNGWHFRIGALRWDEVDSYYEIWTIALHKINF